MGEGEGRGANCYSDIEMTPQYLLIQDLICSYCNIPVKFLWAPELPEIGGSDNDLRTDLGN